MIRLLKKVLHVVVFSAAICALPLSFAYAQSSAQDYFEQGNSLYNQKKYSEAVASYHRAIQMQPHTQAKAYLNCARAYTQLGQYPAAVQYYSFYEKVAADAASDRKFNAEYKAAQKKNKSGNYVRDNAQTTVLKQLEQTIKAGGPYLTQQGNGAFAYYDVLLRAGYAEPDLYELQQKLVSGMSEEIESDITPPPSQPLPNLDRTGWEYIRNKIARLRQFSDISPNASRLSAIESMAYAWEAYYKGDYETAQKQFDAACSSNPAIPAAYWGRVMLTFQQGNSDMLINMISETEGVYQSANIEGTAPFFALLKAKAYQNMGDTASSLKWLKVMNEAF
ncbi:MAG: tetratricopeptide repeat protein [Proteobacteria bacterium]|nr:tetratricopeptide repeat protein [Pseudomonadota bacterium]